MELKEIKINVGCGPSKQLNGFENIDNSPTILLSKFKIFKKLFFICGFLTKQQYKSDWSNVIRCDVSKGLPYQNNTISKIYSSHFLEHIPKGKGRFFLQECYRVLRVNGVMRIVVPDLLFYAEQYVKSTRKILNNSLLPDDRSIHDEFLKVVSGAYLTKKRNGAEHCYMYDLPTLVSILNNVGFKKIESFDYKKGCDNELSNYDSRPEDSLHMEAWK